MVFTSSEKAKKISLVMSRYGVRVSGLTDGQLTVGGGYLNGIV